MTELNHFKYLELIEGESAMALTLKLREIPHQFHYLKVWTDGKKHYAHINMMRPMPKALKEKLNNIKE